MNLSLVILKLPGIAVSSGFRESGITFGQKNIMLAVRTTAFSLEAPIALGSEYLITSKAIDILVNESNLKLRTNFSRIDRFLEAIKFKFGWPSLSLEKCDTTLSVKRWGHSCVQPMPEEPIICIGGYGLDSQSTSPLKSQRTLPINAVQSDTLTLLGPVAINIDEPNQTSISVERMHATSATWTCKPPGGT